MESPNHRCTLLVALLMCAAGCGGSGGSAAPARLASDARDPAGIPEGAGTAAIDMAGSWEVAAFAIEAWDSWYAHPRIADLAGQRFTIAPGLDGGYALRTFGWIQDLDIGSTNRGNWSVGWSRNVGDGRLLIYAFAGHVTGQVIPPPGQRWVPSYAIGVALGATGPNEMLARFVEVGGAAGHRDFTFLARRRRSGSVRPDPRDAARPPATTARASIDMSGRWRITAADVEVYEPATRTTGTEPPALIGAELTIAALPARRFALGAFAWHEPIEIATPASWNVTWARNDGDSTVLIYARNSAATMPRPAVGRTEHRLGVALVAVAADEVIGRYVEFGGPAYDGTFAFTFTARRER